MPQPLNNVLDTASLYFSSDAPTQRPELALLMVTAINAWAQLEGELGALLTKFLQADPHIGAAMYTALNSSDI